MLVKDLPLALEAAKDAFEELQSNVDDCKLWISPKYMHLTKTINGIEITIKIPIDGIIEDLGFERDTEEITTPFM